MKYTISAKKPRDKNVLLVTLAEEGQDEVLVQPTLQKELHLNVGPRGDMTRRKLVNTMRKIILCAKASKMKKVAFSMKDMHFDAVLSLAETAELLATNMEMANFEFIKYKSKPKDGWNFVEEVILSGLPAQAGKLGNDVEKALKRGKMIGIEVNKTRTLSNTPGGDITPSSLAQAAIDAVEGLPITVTVLGVPEMEALGMGAILGVGKGSEDKPKFIIMEYTGVPLKEGVVPEQPIVLVGKGVTFDTGGLNLKPSDFMYEMHMDMSGGAAVIHTIALAARFRLKKNIVALIPAVENMPSGSSYHPGDVLRSMSGKSIEILNTDAEGRVILADALHYAKRFKPRLVVDVATLTGAAMAAFGSRASAIFTKDPEMETNVRELGEQSGDYVWPMPLWDEYEEDIRGTFGDWANMGKSRYGGAINGAMFLYQFIKDQNGKESYPWLHIDMAPRMTAAEGDNLAKGAAGAPVRLLWKILEAY